MYKTMSISLDILMFTRVIARHKCTTDELWQKITNNTKTNTSETNKNYQKKTFIRHSIILFNYYELTCNETKYSVLTATVHLEIRSAQILSVTLNNKSTR